MTPPPLPPPSSTRPRHARWAWLAVPLVLIGCFVAFYALDEAPPDVSDLAFEPLALDDEDNACKLLARAAAEASRRLSSETGYLDSLDEFASGESWDAETIAGWMDALAPVWPLYEHAARTPQSQAPIAHSPR